MATFTKYHGKRGITFRAQIRRTGYPVQSESFKTKKEAKIWATEIENQMDKRKFVSQGDAEKTKLSEALGRYLIEVTPSKKGAAPETARIKQLQTFIISDFSLSRIRTADIANLRNNLQKEDKAPTTIRNLMTIISQVFETARREWGMEALSNPVRGVKMPKHRPGRCRRFVADSDPDKDEETRLLIACRISSCPYLELGVIIALESGMRLSEILSISRKIIDFNNNTVFLEDTKNDESRTVPFSSRAITAIKSAPIDIDGKLIPTEIEQFKYHYRMARDRAGIPDFRFHDIRHEATSRLFEKGLDVMEVASITGHKDLNMLKRYTHLKAADLAKKLG